jgi:hypothetical protein
MSAAANATDPPTQPSRSAGLLGLVRKLIDYGRELATTIRQRVLTDPTSVRCCFGTADVALILARICRGLHRADALEARLLSNAHRLDAAPRGAASPRAPRAPRPAAAPSDRIALVPGLDPGIPTPDRLATRLDPVVAAKHATGLDPVVRRQPIGAVIADICRDLGIMPSHPLWRELQIAIIRECGNFAGFVKDILEQAFPIAAIAPPGSPAPPPRFVGPVRTGPP